MPRKYNKKSSYWKKFESQAKSIEELSESANASCEAGPVFAGETFYSQAGYSRNVNQTDSADATRSRRAVSAKTPGCDKYSHIKNMSLPYSYKDSYISPRDTVLLCQKAYANVPIFRNAIDVMAEFSNSDIYLDGGSEKSKNFINKWLERIQSWKVKDQYFREYYRSGNIFIYKLDGKFKSKDLSSI